MPKIYDTRKDKALALIRSVQQGPKLTNFDHHELTIEEFEQHYKMWSQSWIIPALIELIPELKHLKGKQL